ncbi:M48 family metallopeptidase [Apibacter sp. HY039]|uniref:M48 family metallopeptidase n=1 Tax=Apibacter sp. HY039 TaxID=2501476 RepID=UPI0021074EAC|nr:M48 family metallopeptidase [Apibacter sp. HY039]
MKIIRMLFILCSGIAFSQNYMPIDTADKNKREEAASLFSESGKKFIESLKKEYSGKELKLLVKEFEEFNKEFKEEIKEGNFCYDSRFTDYAAKILEKLRVNNSSIPQNLNLLISKDPSLNAFCLPDGTFVLNMGLFYWMDNEDQIASVLSHELSHNMLNHSLRKQVGIVRERLSSTNKEKIKEIKKQKYNRSQAALDLYKNRLYAAGESSKKDEYQADSLGYVLMKKSPYNEGAFLGALELMAKYDSIRPKGLEDEIYKKIFNLPNQPFKDEWLKKEDFSQYDYSLYKEKINKDSVSTHPEIEFRIARLKSEFSELNSDFKKSTPNEEFKGLEKIAGYERVPSLYFFEQYGVGIYLCLYQLQNNPEDTYYTEWLGKCFEKIYEGRKNYKLNRYLAKINPKNQSESYQQFLNFMWNLSLDEIKNISDYYNKKAPQ